MLRSSGRAGLRSLLRRLASSSGKSEASKSSSAPMLLVGTLAVVLGAGVSGKVAYDRDSVFRAKVDEILRKAGLANLLPQDQAKSGTKGPPDDLEEPSSASNDASHDRMAEPESKPTIETEAPTLHPQEEPTVASPVSLPEENHPDQEKQATDLPEVEAGQETSAQAEVAEEPRSSTQADTRPVLGVVRAEETAESLRHEVIPRTLEELMAQTAVTRREVEESILRGLEGLDESALRLRLLRLAADFFERTKWEGVRLHHAMRQVETEVSARYKELMAQQRAELELEAEKANIRMLAALQAESSARHEDEVLRFERELREALHQQGEELRSQSEDQLRKQSIRIHEELQDQLHHEVAKLRESHVKALLELQERLEETGGLLRALSDAVEQKHQRIAFSAASHAQAAAILALENSLQKTTPIRETVDILRASCSEDELSVALLQALPAVALDRGVPTTSDLRKRFEVVRGEVRKAALAPTSAPSLVGQAVGSLLASLSWAPSGFVPGEGIEERLARAHFMLEHDDLGGCLKELKGLRGFSTVLMKDWLDSAESRLCVERVVGAMRANAALQHAAYAEAYAKEQTTAQE